MVLDKLASGASRRTLFDPGTRRLAFILCLPLVDGVFATLLVTGAVNTFSQMLNVAVTIFTGAGALAVLYSESENVSEALKMVNSVIPVLFIGVVAVALVAPVFEHMFNTELLKYAAGIAILSISLQILDLEVAKKFPPSAVILTGLVLSFRGVSRAPLTFEYVAPALTTAGLAIFGLYLASGLKKYSMELDYIRYGAFAVLGIISLSLFGFEVPQNIGVFVFAVSVAVAVRRS